MSWFTRKSKKLLGAEKKAIPDGLWLKCPSCSEILYTPELEKSNSVCIHCQHHFRVAPSVYVNLLLDKGTDREVFNNLYSNDPLNFKAGKSYQSQLKKAQANSGESEAVQCYLGTIEGESVVLSVMNFKFIGGSMGSVVGEKIGRSIDLANEKKLPFILICASGGARMQEGALSLMQLANTSARLARFSENGGLYIPILTDPTTGGVTASFGMLGDLILAEPGALIGFAGPRVIKQTIGQDLPQGFQRAEFQLEKGFIDMIVPRNQLKSTLKKIISTLK